MSIEEKHRMAGRNQSLFRDVNERIRRVSSQMIPTETVGFLCECADTGCVETMQLTLAEYEVIRLNPKRFPIVAGHEWPDVERVVQRNDRYEIVEKVGQAAEIAVQEWRRPDAGEIAS
jgi:hypothetical protein